MPLSIMPRALMPASLAVAAAECDKTSHVDIRLMLSNCENAAQIVTQLSQIENDPVRLAALEQLIGMLNYHQVTLGTKIKQLDGQNCIGPWGDKAEQSVVLNTKIEGQYDNELSSSGEKQTRQTVIHGTKVSPGGLTFSDVAGLDQAKQALKEAIIMPIEYPHLFTGGRKPWRRILLYGPPGTGKSRLAQAVAGEIKSSFFCVSSSDLLSSWVGESEKLIKELFQSARTNEGMSVIFIDEIDSVCRRRSSGEEEHSRRIKTELLHQMEGAMTAGALSDQRVFLLAATNCPWELDPGFLRRFQKRIYIPLPDKFARQQLMQIHIKDTVVPLSEDEWEQLTEVTAGYSGSDLANMVLGALFEPIRELQKTVHWRHTNEGHLIPCQPGDPGAFKSPVAALPADEVMPRDLCLEDFLLSLKQHQKTVTADDLSRFDEFTQHFGQSG